MQAYLQRACRCEQSAGAGLQGAWLTLLCGFILYLSKNLSISYRLSILLVYSYLQQYVMVFCISVVSVVTSFSLLISLIWPLPFFLTSLVKGLIFIYLFKEFQFYWCFLFFFFIFSEILCIKSVTIQGFLPQVDICFQNLYKKRL